MFFTVHVTNRNMIYVYTLNFGVDLFNQTKTTAPYCGNTVVSNFLRSTLFSSLTWDLWPMEFAFKWNLLERRCKGILEIEHRETLFYRSLIWIIFVNVFIFKYLAIGTVQPLLSSSSVTFKCRDYRIVRLNQRCKKLKFFLCR